MKLNAKEIKILSAIKNSFYDDFKIEFLFHSNHLEGSTFTKENLEKLISDCEMVLKNKDNAKEIIPTASGFFFGSTEYDEYYFSDIEYTLEKMKNLINQIDWENESLYYTEWW